MSKCKHQRLLDTTNRDGYFCLECAECGKRRFEIDEIIKIVQSHFRNIDLRRADDILTARKNELIKETERADAADAQAAEYRAALIDIYLHAYETPRGLPDDTEYERAMARLHNVVAPLLVQEGGKQ